MTDLDTAKEFVRSRVIRPALNSPVDAGIKEKIRSADGWISKFKRTGDLLKYIGRFDGIKLTEVYNSLNLFGLSTFEGIRQEFADAFKHAKLDVSSLDDFVIGESYPSSDLVILAQTYANRSGGILPIRNSGQLEAVIVKATLEGGGGEYDNKWLNKGSDLKYFLKARKGVFKESYVENAAIINSPDIPIYTFVREKNEGPFIFFGIFKNSGIMPGKGKSKWFRLECSTPLYDSARSRTFSLEQLKAGLDSEVKKSQTDSRDARRARLERARKTPLKVQVTSTVYVRNPDVIVEALDRAQGTCEGCRKLAPFNRSSDGSPYLEVHHKVPLAKGGDDTLENVMAICANCHRQEHHGAPRWPAIDLLPVE